MTIAGTSTDPVESGDVTAGGSHVLVVISAVAGVLREPWLVAQIAGTVRETFERCELITSLSNGRILAVVERDRFTENRIQETAWLLRRRLPSRFLPRIEALDLPGEA
ncbi:MAG: hypothetical protein ACJ72L_02215 [Marmoricola sp.]